MTKRMIIKELSERHVVLVDYILSLSCEEFNFSYNQNWTAGQQMEHIHRATSILPFLLKMPLPLNGFFFGKAKKPAKNYNELVEVYLSKLKDGAKATKRFIPSRVPYSNRINLANKLLKNITGINEAIDKISEKDLDCYVLPHPLLGKLTYREMLYFTIYHAHHHCVIAGHYIEKIKGRVQTELND